MKTAEEIFNEVFDEFSTEKGTPLSFSVKAMKIYAEQACRDQRMICAYRAELKINNGRPPEINTKSITSAPPPDLK
jgi:hypothetical protein